MCPNVTRQHFISFKTAKSLVILIFNAYIYRNKQRYHGTKSIRHPRLRCRRTGRTIQPPSFPPRSRHATPPLDQSSWHPQRKANRPGLPSRHTLLHPETGGLYRGTFRGTLNTSGKIRLESYFISDGCGSWQNGSYGEGGRGEGWGMDSRDFCMVAGAFITWDNGNYGSSAYRSLRKSDLSSTTSTPSVQKGREGSEDLASSRGFCGMLSG